MATMRSRSCTLLVLMGVVLVSEAAVSTCNNTGDIATFVFSQRRRVRPKCCDIGQTISTGEDGLKLARGNRGYDHFWACKGWVFGATGREEGLKRCSDANTGRFGDADIANKACEIFVNETAHVNQEHQKHCVSVECHKKLRDTDNGKMCIYYYSDIRDQYMRKTNGLRTMLQVAFKCYNAINRNRSFDNLRYGILQKARDRISNAVDACRDKHSTLFALRNQLVASQQEAFAPQRRSRIRSRPIRDSLPALGGQRRGRRAAMLRMVSSTIKLVTSYVTRGVNDRMAYSTRPTPAPAPDFSYQDVTTVQNDVYAGQSLDVGIEKLPSGTANKNSPTWLLRATDEFLAVPQYSYKQSQKRSIIDLFRGNARQMFNPTADVEEYVEMLNKYAMIHKKYAVQLVHSTPKPKPMTSTSPSPPKAQGGRRGAYRV